MASFQDRTVTPERPNRNVPTAVGGIKWGALGFGDGGGYTGYAKIPPIGSMGPVYLPTFTIKINHSCIGKYTIPGSHRIEQSSLEV